MDMNPDQVKRDQMFKRTAYFKVYEISMALLALIVSIIILIEFTFELSTEMISIFEKADTVILFIFMADYFIRLFFAKNKIQFIKSNIIDLIAIIPFNSIFQAARLVRLLRFVRFLKILRLFGFLILFYKRFEKFLKTNNFHYTLFVTLGTVIIGAVCISFAEEMTLPNALWWAFVTTTTVGYGDISPTTPLGRIIAVFLMIIGISFIGMLTGTISTYFLKKAETRKNFKDEVLENIKQKLDNFEQLEISEVDEICHILTSLKQSELNSQRSLCDEKETEYTSDSL